MRLPPLAFAFGITGLLGAALGCGGAPEPATPSPSSPSSPSTPTASPSSPAAVDGSASGVDPDAAPSARNAAAPPPGSPPGGWPFGQGASAEDRAAQLDRLKKDPGPIKTNWVPPGRSERYGHAEGLVNAPVAAVRAKLVDFAHYKELAGPKFKTVRVIAKEGDATDVYFQLPIMKGLITISYVTRFPPSRAAAGGDVVEGSFVKGNIKGMHIAFTVLPGPDEKSAVMICDLLLSPGMPAPQSAVDEELRDACGDAINSVRRTTGSTGGS